MQGRVHPLQGADENFLGYFTIEFFGKIDYRTKRQAIDNAESNPHAKLHPTIRPHPVFVNHNEALEKHYALRTRKTVPVSEELRRKAELTI